MSMFDERVEAAAEAMSCRWRIPKEGHPKHEHCKTLCIPLARAALEAADAVVTEGRVEEALYKAFQGWDEESDDLFAVQARAVMMLFRGGAK